MSAQSTCEVTITWECFRLGNDEYIHAELHYSYCISTVLLLSTSDMNKWPLGNVLSTLWYMELQLTHWLTLFAIHNYTMIGGCHHANRSKTGGVRCWPINSWFVSKSWQYGMKYYSTDMFCFVCVFVSVFVLISWDIMQVLGLLLTLHICVSPNWPLHKIKSCIRLCKIYLWTHLPLKCITYFVTLSETTDQ